MDLLGPGSGTLQPPVSAAHMVVPFQLPEQTKMDPSLRGRGGVSRATSLRPWPCFSSLADLARTGPLMVLGLLGPVLLTKCQLNSLNHRGGGGGAEDGPILPSWITALSPHTTLTCSCASGSRARPEVVRFRQGLWPCTLLDLWDKSWCLTLFMLRNHQQSDWWVTVTAQRLETSRSEGNACPHSYLLIGYFST